MNCLKPEKKSETTWKSASQPQGALSRVLFIEGKFGAVESTSLPLLERGNATVPADMYCDQGQQTSYTQKLCNIVTRRIRG